MRIARLVATAATLAAFWTFTERRAVADTAAASDGLPSIALHAPHGPAADPGRLGCECAPIAATNWHWTERRILGLKAIGFGVLAGTAGVAFAWDAHRIFDDTPRTSFMVQAENQRIRDRQIAASALLGVGGLAVLVGAGLVLWPESHHVSVVVVPNGGAFVACGGTI
jgi:hypothetical protein